MSPMVAPLPNLYGLDRQELAAALAPLGVAPYRVRQVHRALYRRDALAPEGWTDLPTSLRAAIAGRFRVVRPGIVGRTAASDGTVKYELGLEDGARVEAVAIPADGRMTFCISSQVGCAFGCAFCMTARLGFRRHLDTGEIVGQVAALRAETNVDQGAYNIVFMGMGEPLHNFDALERALRILGDDLGFALGPRRLTVSTVGLPDRIRALARVDPPPRLAVSLVSADPDVRASLMPVARRHSLDELAAAIRDYGADRRDRPTLEVVLLAGVNDTPEQAERLARYAAACRAKVNLIEFNPTPELPFAPASDDTIERFLGQLVRRGITATVRRSRGRDAFAACGQLAFLDAVTGAPGARGFSGPRARRGSRETPRCSDTPTAS
ncbi:MAG: 23S rRNA (adenine(2503)-C(2))-methyltransferase RlmN [Acidobacteria bacterium]|nr:MAG: 23S rRNA (adenine(2503)-C(2))-methyltransferase RlmN [Acidobacteriota bacterium]